ncbi:magnesium-transporting ATPase (P-type) [Pedobacter cryoconitis]|uniref:Magnesium-transporting ATPase (P-type) n=1 Tax=Pedobacter cryoconitis TaxID=188932 RepID=A0A7X0J501_9SPHI|nr:magnesium-transporting ATPase (P-type) [Pedobacter cryoconitis]
MFHRINFYNIINDHLITLRRIDTPAKKISTGDFLLFFLFPLLISITLSYFKIKVDNHIAELITAVSIIGGFLFNLLAIIYGLMDKLIKDTQNQLPKSESGTLKKIFIKEVHINISFNILISLFLLICLLAYSYLPKNYCAQWMMIFNYVLTALIYFLLIIFFLTMLMILNRIYILLKKTDIPT